MRLFIPEQYVRSRDLVIEVPGEGLGVLVTSVRLQELLRAGLVDPRVVTDNLMKVVHEH
jgi:hypothetical protein